MVLATLMVPSEEEMQELRRLFHEREAKEGVTFHPADISRMEDGNRWVSKFLSYNDLNMKNAAQQLWETCKWRKEFGTNDLTADNVREDYRDAGLYFSRGKDLDGKDIFYFKCKLFVRGSRNSDELKRVLVYWIERTLRENDWDLITPIFDMSGCGLSNVDIGYLNWIIEVLKNYYPDQVNYIIVYDMAWILNATFQLIKKLLPPKAVDRLKLVNSKTIKQFIDENNMPADWGFKDSYKFSFVPEKSLGVNNNNNNNNNDLNFHPEKLTNGHSEDFEGFKKVHFAQNTFSNPGAPETTTPMAESHLLRVTPSEAIVFKQIESNDLCGQVKIQNIVEDTITYKIKTTAPEKFRVRPPSGILHKGESVSITVVFNHGPPAATLSRDKFLVMCMPLSLGSAGGEPDAARVADLWKNTPSSAPNVEQHRLRCSLGDSVSDSTLKNGKVFESSFESTSGVGHVSLVEIQGQLQELRSSQRFSNTLQWITMGLFVLLSIAIVYIIKFEIKNNSYEYCVRQ